MSMFYTLTFITVDINTVVIRRGAEKAIFLGQRVGDYADGSDNTLLVVCSSKAAGGASKSIF